MIDDEWCRLRGLSRFKTERQPDGDLYELERGGRHGERWYLVVAWPFGTRELSYKDEDVCDVCDRIRQASARRFMLSFQFRHVWDDHPFYRLDHFSDWWPVEVCWSCFNRLRKHVSMQIEIEATSKLIRKVQKEIANERKATKDQHDGNATGVPG